MLATLKYLQHPDLIFLRALKDLGNICVSSVYRRGIVDSRQDNTCVATSPEYKMKRYHKKSKQTARAETFGKKI